MRYRQHDVICLASQSFMVLTCLIYKCASLGKAASAARRAEGRMPSPSFSLNAQLRFHDKWLKIDLQVNLGKGFCHRHKHRPLGYSSLDAKYRVLMFFRGAGIYRSPYSKATWFRCWSTLTLLLCLVRRQMWFLSLSQSRTCLLILKVFYIVPLGEYRC